eukprot:TRINITY_DN7978_c0_g1_i1.p1 TRINITY_DN7978_c0_g1~~TRINITY_DN7978_c0_g1_i1.p1  ORF type:complete len:166 (+),score=15.34 TRINITY_DN7978_c0_g1_i1:88-585(+)
MRFKFALLSGVPLIIAFRDRIASLSTVEGRSMQPTLNPDFDKTLTRDLILVDHLSARLRKLSRGDVVVLRSSKDRKAGMVKRLLAFEHDVVTSADGCQRYTSIPAGHVWIEGDCPAKSSDSNRYGPVPEGLIYGKVRAVVWPPSRWSIIGNQRDDNRLKHVSDRA